ncbi:hypothetical protein LZ554_004562 [Drepanopeziza brunnea f. sp. 'monogermtubi']|nr:hypothetical protein LZ554_004562 [Drepanopeziza brunnea f. sp. 'monogermtubi']
MVDSKGKDPAPPPPVPMEDLVETSSKDLAVEETTWSLEDDGLIGYGPIDPAESAHLLLPSYDRKEIIAFAYNVSYRTFLVDLELLNNREVIPPKIAASAYARVLDQKYNESSLPIEHKRRVRLSALELPTLDSYNVHRNWSRMSTEEQQAWESEDEDDRIELRWRDQSGDLVRKGTELVRKAKEVIAKYKASGAYKKPRGPAPRGDSTMSAKAEMNDGSSASTAAMDLSTTALDSETQM